MKTKRKRFLRNSKSEIPPFDAKCKNCDRAIPEPLDFCSSKCRREYLGIPTPKYISTRNDKKKRKRGQRRL